MKRILLVVLRFFLYCFSYVVRLFTRVDKHKIVCVANGGKIYGCNPKYITEYLLANSTEFTIYWLFDKHADISDLDKRIHVLRPFSIKYVWVINTAGIIINNFRTRFYEMSWRKRKGQIYIMTWHGPLALKRIEKDVHTEGRDLYNKIIDDDNKQCDLMLSCSQFTNRLIRGAMDFKGEILESGLPRNDIFYHREVFPSLKEKVYKRYGIPYELKVVLYAPTFRTDHTTDCYNIEWHKIVPALNKYFNDGNFVILYRLHPDLIVPVGVGEDGSARIINVSEYPDIQELLCISDILITDYSSSMFEFALLKRPCFIYASDHESYDRSYYFNIKELPFPFASNSEELCEIINHFNNSKYLSLLDSFYTKEFGYYENGSACESLYHWLHSKTN